MELKLFYILAHLFISLIGAALLLAIWYNINTTFKRRLEEDVSQKRIDKGLIYLSLSLFVWVVAGLWALAGLQISFTEKLIFPIGINLLSTLNNLFLLLALFYFDFAPKFIYQNPKNVNKIIVAILTLAILSVSLTVMFYDPNASIKWGNLPDLFLSGFLSYLLLISLYRTFINRGLRLVAMISSAAIVLMFVSQLSEVFTILDDEFTDNLIKITAKTSLISIFLVLATSWVIQLVSTPSPDEMRIRFLDWSLVKISIPTKGIHQETIDFGSKMTQYKNLLKFAVRRKYGTGNDQCISVNARGEIKNQTYLSRIIDNINEIHNGEEDQKLERKDLFTFIGQGQYRLRMNPENISMDEALLHEFCKDPENEAYTTIVTNCNSTIS